MSPGEIYRVEVELVDLCLHEDADLHDINELANFMYMLKGHDPKESGYNFSESRNEFEYSCFQEACVAFNFTKKMRT